MGRIAYLSKRGNVWWYRRRHPAISIKPPQNPHETLASSRNWTTVQARGHVAVSLQTMSAREARRTAAVLTDLLERAWAMIEEWLSGMTDEDQDQAELIEETAVIITQNIRRAVQRFRQMPLSSPEVVRAKAFQMLSAELREALGVGPEQIDQSLPLPRPVPAGSTAPRQAEDQSRVHRAILDMLTHEEFEELARLNLANGDLYTGVPDDFLIQQFEGMMIGVAEMLEQYLKACDRSGLDPAKALPIFAESASDFMQAAARIGVATPQASVSSERQPRVRMSDELFSKLAGRYLDLRSQGYTLRREDETSHPASGETFVRTSLGNYKSSVKLFIQLVGDLPLSKIGKDEILAFNELLQSVPTTFGRSSKDKRPARQFIEEETEAETERLATLHDDLIEKGTPPREIEEQLAKARMERISVTTVKRHQTALNSIFEYAVREGLIQKNPFNGRMLTEAEVKRRRKMEAKILRTDWGDHIYTLLASEIFTEPLVEIDESLFWMPLIAMFGGLRMEEICQLRLDDFATEDGIPYLAVQNSIGTQRLKSENGFRKVPLHRALIEIGILDLVKHQRERGFSRLFPNLPRSLSKGTLSGNMSKRFRYYIESRGIKQPGLDFHALRTDFQHRLTRNKVPKHVRSGFMGHEQDDVTTANYFRQGELMADLRDYINRVNIDVSNVRLPFKPAEASAISKTGGHLLRLVQG